MGSVKPAKREREREGEKGERKASKEREREILQSGPRRMQLGISGFKFSSCGAGYVGPWWGGK